MLKLFGILFILAGIAAGFFYGIQIVVSGISLVADSFKANPTDGWGILRGILMITPLAELVGVCLIGLGGLIGVTMLEVKVDKHSKSLFNWR